MIVTLYSSISTENWIRYEIARRMHTWSSIAFYLAVFVNFIVAYFYPFVPENTELSGCGNRCG